MREPGDRFQSDHCRGALDGMGRAESLIQVRTVSLAPLQVHQPFLQADQVLPRLLEEHFTETVVRTPQDLHLLKDTLGAQASDLRRG